MTFIIIVVAFLITLFLVTITVIRTLNRVRLKSSLKKADGKVPKSIIINTLTKLLKNDPYDITSRLELAKEYIKSTNFSEAIIHLNYILNNIKNLTNIEKADINNLLAQCYINSKDYDEAYKIYSTLKIENPEDPSNYINLAHINNKLGKKEEAITLLSKAIDIDNNNIDVIKELGILLYKNSNFPESMATLQMGYKIAPGDPEINYYLAILHYKFDKAKDAYKHLLISKGDPRYSVESFFYIGKILFQYEKFNASLKIFEKLLKVPNLKRDLILEIRYHVGEIYLKRKDLPKAIAQWEKILSQASNFKDTREKLDRYEQTKTNALLRNYMMSTKNEFVTLCKMIAEKFSKNVVIIRNQANPDSTVDIFIQAIYKGMDTTILLRFFRSNSNIGQFAIRDFYEKVKETKVKLGICFTSSGYSDKAITFSKGRAVDLYDKEKLMKLLSKIQL